MNPKVAGYDVVSGMLHNFGGKNAMQGKLRKHCENKYLTSKEKGANVVGSGMFMEGIDQNPVIYDLQFESVKLGIFCSKHVTRMTVTRKTRSVQLLPPALSLCQRERDHVVFQKFITIQKNLKRLWTCSLVSLTSLKTQEAISTTCAIW